MTATVGIRHSPLKRSLPVDFDDDAGALCDHFLRHPGIGFNRYMGGGFRRPSRAPEGAGAEWTCDSEIGLESQGHLAGFGWRIDAVLATKELSGVAASFQLRFRQELEIL